MADFHQLTLHPSLKVLLEWVDQDPPSEARDTHALQFDLKETIAPGQFEEPQPPHRPSMHYQGLMFFRPGELTGLNVNVLLGLEGAGRLVATDTVCKRVLGPLSPSPDNEIWKGLQWVQVRIMIRGRPGDPQADPELFSRLAFFRDTTGSAEIKAGEILGPVSHSQDAVPSLYTSHVDNPDHEHEAFVNRIVMESGSHVPGGPVDPRKWIMDLQKTTVLLKNTPP